MADLEANELAEKLKPVWGDLYAQAGALQALLALVIARSVKDEAEIGKLNELALATSQELPPSILIARFQEHVDRICAYARTHVQQRGATGL